MLKAQHYTASCAGFSAYKYTYVVADRMTGKAARPNIIQMHTYTDLHYCNHTNTVQLQYTTSMILKIP